MIALSLSLPATATRAVLFFGVLLLSWPGWPQEPRPAVATVSFSLDFPQSIPDHYVLTVSSDGHAGYDSTGKLTVDADPGDPFHLDFTISPGTRVRIFELAAKARYFEEKVDSGKRNLASTGAKVLTYRDGQRSTQAAYNYSPIPAVRDLTAVFQNISTTLEFGRRLDYYYHYQKLALEEELKRMEQMVNEKSLEELQAVAPILQRIVADPSVINVTRARAQRLLSGSGVAASR
ncbi:MAG TPA: hypothetical protein VE083_02175 [Terriglobales bacterium]|nr:hypothetical protein [Terriglobales bacterium]